MLAPAFTDCLGATVEKPPGTVAERIKSLRIAGMFSCGTQGPGRGAHVSETDATNALLAALLDHRRGECVAANVQRFRDFPVVAANYTDGFKGSKIEAGEQGVKIKCFTGALRFRGKSKFGDALDALVSDMRSGVFSAWSESTPFVLTIDIHEAERAATIFLDRPAYDMAVVFAYGDTEKRAVPVSRIIRIDGLVLQRIASALGPPPG